MAVPDDYLNVSTPENVVFDYEVAGIGSRFLAALVDTLLIIVLQLIVNLTLFLLVATILGDLVDWNEQVFMWLLAAFGLIGFAFLWGYYVLFEALWSGQSPGKRWAGLRVVRTDGTPIGLPESLVRNLVRLIDFLPAYYGVGVVTMFANAQSRRLGDLAAGTLVVRERPTVTLESLAAGARAPGLAAALPADPVRDDLPLERLSRADIQLAEEYLRRRAQLSDSSGLAYTIARSLCAKMELPVTRLGERSADYLIVQVVQASRAREMDHAE